MAKAGQIILPYGDSPDNPPATGKVSLYAKNDKALYYKIDSGEEIPITASGGYAPLSHEHSADEILNFIEEVQDAMAPTISGLGNVTVIYDDAGNAITISGTPGITDHGLLSGLGDDDHTQYHTDARGDARYYTETESDDKFENLTTGVVGNVQYTYNSGGTITMSGTEVILRESTAFASAPKHYNMAPAEVSIPNKSSCVVVATIVSGSAVYDVYEGLEVFLIDLCTTIPVITLYRADDDLFARDWNDMSRGMPEKTHTRLTLGHDPAYLYGLTTTLSGSAYLQIAAGSMYIGSVSLNYPGFDSSVSDINFFYHDTSFSGVDGWGYTNQSQLNNTYYDDGSALVELTTGYYTNNWVYIISSSDSSRAVIITNSEEYDTLNSALSADIPQEKPGVCSALGVLVARITMQKGVTDGTIVSAFLDTFTGRKLDYHNALDGLQGGASDAMYHLDQASFNNLVYGDPAVFTTVSASHYYGVDHGELNGLSDDDHPQYHTDARGDIRYYTKSEVDTISGSINDKIFERFTVEEAQDAVGSMVDINSLSYTDATPLLAVKRQMSITADTSGLKLDGDILVPGVNRLYGTDATGAKGWYATPSGLNASGNDMEIQFNDSNALGADASFRWDKVNQALLLGDNPTLLPNNAFAYQKDVDAYIQVNVQNTSSGTNASSDYIITADDGDDSSFYTDFGMCNSNYDVEIWDAALAHDGYAWVDGGNFVVGTLTPGKKINFAVASIEHELHQADIVAEMDVDGINVTNGRTYRVDGQDVLAHDFERNSAGRVLGGTISKGTVSGTITVASGIGYAASGDKYVRVVWPTYTNQAVAGITYNYIAIDNTGALHITLAETTSKEYIRLGRCWYDPGASDVTAVWNIPAVIGDYQKTLNTFFQECMGTIVQNGFEVSEQSTPNELKLNIEEGTLWVRSSPYTFSSQTEFVKMFQCADFYVLLDTVNNDNTVDTTLWNDKTQNGYSALVTLASGTWAKALVCITTTGQVYYVYPEAEYATEDLAKNGILPFADTLRDDDNAFLATIVFQAGDTSISNRIYDIRPYFPKVFGSANLVAGGTVVDHRSLTGLTHDDHEQYHNDTRGDIRYYTKGQVDTISGSINSKIIIDHGLLTGLGDDDHTQYHTDARGDARYYTQSQVNGLIKLPGSPLNSLQYNNNGDFAGTTGMLFDSVNNKLTLSGTNATTRMVLGGEDDNTANAALYIQVDGDTTSEGMRTYFKRSTAGINGWITYYYDGNTPNIRITDEDDDPPYISFRTIGTGSYDTPQYANNFGSRGPAAGSTTGFKWEVNGTTIANMDSQWFQPPAGTTAQRPGTPTAGMIRYNTTVSNLETYNGTDWLSSGNFGTYFVTNSSDTSSSTTSSTFQLKLSLSTGTVPAGVYRIGWYYEWGYNGGTTDFRAQVQINNTTTIMEQRQEPQDVGTDQWHPVGGFYNYTAATSAALTIDLDYCSSAAGSTSYIRNARLEFWRVS